MKTLTSSPTIIKTYDRPTHKSKKDYVTTFYYKLKCFNFSGECGKKISFTVLAQPPREIEVKVGQPVSYFLFRACYWGSITWNSIVDLPGSAEYPVGSYF